MNRAIIAGIITISIFVAGFSLGSLWEVFREEKIQKELDEMSVYSTSLLLQSQLIEEATCPAFFPILTDALKDLRNSLDRYTTYTESSFFDMDGQNLLYRQYLMANIKYWMFAEKYKEQCGWNTSIIIYFFDGDCGDNCTAMSTRLDYLKRKYEDELLVFPVNLNLAKNDPIAKTMVYLYNVTTFPTIMTNGEIYHELSIDELEDLVCQSIIC